MEVFIVYGWKTDLMEREAEVLTKPYLLFVAVR